MLHRTSSTIIYLVAVSHLINSSEEWRHHFTRQRPSVPTATNTAKFIFECKYLKYIFAEVFSLKIPKAHYVRVLKFVIDYINCLKTHLISQFFAIKSMKIQIPVLQEGKLVFPKYLLFYKLIIGLQNK